MRRLLLLLLALCFASPALADWKIAETAHFRVYGDMRESALRDEATRLEDFHNLLETLTGRKFPANAPKLDIYLADDIGDLRLFNPGFPPEVLGFYRPDSESIIAVAITGGQNEWLPGRQVLFHEYAHHFMFQVGAAAMPAWYVEGFAEYMMTADIRDERIEFGNFNMGRAFGLLNEAWVPMETVIGSLPSAVPQSQRSQFYAQAWLMTHYLFRVEGQRDKLTDYLRRVAAGEPSLDAFKAAIAPDLSEFRRRLNAYLGSSKLTLSRAKRTAPPPASVTVTALPPCADNAVLPLAALQLSEERATDQANLARVRAAIAKCPTDPWGARALAIAESIAGDRAAAAARLDAVLAAAPDDVDALRWRARLHDAFGADSPTPERLAARRLLARAFRVAPDDWRVLSTYAATFPLDTAPPSVTDVLTKATVLAPQVSSLAVRAALALAKAGEYKLAYAALAPAVFDPHREPPAGARALADALKREDPSAVRAALSPLGITTVAPPRPTPAAAP